MGKTKKKAAEAQEEVAAPSRLGYVLGGAVGLGVLLLLWGLSQKTLQRKVEELPHLTLLVEFNDLGDPQTRSELVRLQRELVNAKLNVRGPLNYPILVPSAQPGDMPIPRDLDALSEDEFARAQPFLQVGGWLSPRIYAPDLRSAVLRVGPVGRGRFRPGVRKIVQDVLARFEGKFQGVWPYSHDLGLEEPEARGRTNVVFGVQTAHIEMKSNLEAQPQFDTAVKLVKLQQSLRRYAHPQLRSVITEGAFYEYALAVQAHQATAGMMPGDDQNAPLKELFKSCRTPPLVGPKGLRGVIEIATDAEGKANLELCYSTAANLPRTETVAYVVKRKRW